MTGIRSTNNNDCDTFNSCDTTCTSSNNYLQTSSYKQTFSLPEVTDSSAPSWSQSPVLTFSNTFSRSITVGLECYDDDGLGKEGPWSKTVTHNNIDGSAAGKKSSELQFGSLGPYYTNFYYYMTVKCSTNYFNTQCSEFCQAGSPSVCTGCDANTGYCTCSVGYTGKDCESCATNYYPYSSSCRYCLANSGGCYGCDATGARTCCASHRAPDCTALKDCGPFPAVPANAEKLVDDNYLGSGLQVCKNTTYDSYCIYRCKSGYSGGNVQIQCPASEVWPTPTLNCVDINECQTGTHNCNQNCQNTDGDYTCSCNSGFYKNGDGRGPGGCININECSLSDKGGCEQVCNDTIGSYFCTCNSGYQLNGDGKTCRNINECTEGGNNCSPNAFCNDTIGSFYCTCKPGYSGNGVTCNDIDECLTTPCDPNASCQNLPGSFKCTCSVGYRGDGFTCIPSGAVNFDESSRTVVAKEGDSITLLVNAVVERDDCSVQFSITGTAASGTDYLLLNSDHTLAFTTSTNQTTISFFISDDSVPEELETITVTITDPVRMVLGSHIVSTIYIEANDNPYGVVQIKNGSRAFSVNMGVPTYSLVVERVLFTNKNYNAVVSIQGFHPSSSNFSVTIPVNQTEATLTIPLPFSTTPSLAALYNFTITEAACGAACGDSSPFIGYYRSSVVTINEHDDPHGVFNIFSNALTIIEGGSLTVGITRDFGTFGTVTVRVRTAPISPENAGGFALADTNDYVPFDSNIVFLEGENDKQFTISVIDDSVPELAEAFAIELYLVSGFGRIGSVNVARVVIPENDNARGSLSVTPLVSCVEESSLVVHFQVVRSGGTFGNITFSWSTGDGKYSVLDGDVTTIAVANSDYQAVNSQTVTISEGQSDVTVAVTIFDDAIPEITEYFNVFIFNATGGATINPIQNFTNICIAPNDNPYGLISFVPPVLVGPVNNRRLLATEGNVLTFNITRSFGTFGNISGSVVLHHETTSNADFGALSSTFTLAPGQQHTTVSFFVTSNDGDESTEFFNAELVPNVVTTATMQATSINNRTALDYRIPAAIDANSAQYGIVRFVENYIRVYEEAGFVTLTVERVGANVATNSSFAFEAIPGTASGQDFDASNDNNEVTFYSDMTELTYSIVIENDDVPELDKEFYVSLVNYTGLAKLSFASVATVVIAYNDGAYGIFKFGPSSGSDPLVFTATEGDGFLHIPVKRESAQFGNVTVSFIVTNDPTFDSSLVPFYAKSLPLEYASFVDDINATSYVLYFAEGETEHDIVIPIYNDYIIEPSKTFFVLLTTATDGSSIGSPKAIAVILKDNDFENSSAMTPAAIAGAGAGAAILILLVLLLLLVLSRRRQRQQKILVTEAVELNIVTNKDDNVDSLAIPLELGNFTAPNTNLSSSPSSVPPPLYDRATKVTSTYDKADMIVIYDKATQSPIYDKASIDALPPPLPARTRLASTTTNTKTNNNTGQSTSTESPLYASVVKPRAELVLEKELGSGEFGQVFFGLAPINWFSQSANLPLSSFVTISSKYSNTKDSICVKVAVKVLKTESNEKARRDFTSEVELMRKFNHPNVVSFIAIFNETEPWMLVLEYIPYGDLKKLVVKCNENQLLPTDVENSFIFHQIACGMEYLGRKNFIHRDLAARNCLVGFGLTVKISDFGLSHKLVDEDDYYRIQSKGKLPVKWMGPEIINYKKSSYASDVWSFGVLMWEVLSFGATPYGNMRGPEVIAYLEKGNRLPNPNPNSLYCNKLYSQIMLPCWQWKAEDRPSFTQLVNYFSTNYNGSNNDHESSIRDLGEMIQSSSQA